MPTTRPLIFDTATGFIESLPTGTPLDGDPLRGNGPPKSVTGYFGQTYHDYMNNDQYICTSHPTGTTWRVI